METFNTIVSICSGASVIIALLITLVKPLRERITKSKEREEAIQKNFKEVRDEIADVKKDVDSVRSSIDRNEAERARTQILRFGDEIYSQPEERHTKEHFEEILDACDKYNHYCDTHPEFENMRTMETQLRIKHIYQKCLKNHSFLGSKEENQND